MDNPFISVRRYIKWGDEERGEDTNTLVLTTREKYYIDIRILLSPSHPLPNDPSDPASESSLQWAFAGTCSSSPAKVSSSGEILKPAHTVWEHWVDSSSCVSASVSNGEKDGGGDGGKDEGDDRKDEGDMYPQSDGTVLEYGSMRNPRTGKVTKYEECWEDLETGVVGGGGGEKEEGGFVSWVLVCDDTSNDIIETNSTSDKDKDKNESISMTKTKSKSKSKGMIIRIGQIIQGMVIKDGKVGVVRWEWKHGDGDGDGSEGCEWQRTLAIGRVEVPGCLFEDERGVVREGEELMGSDGLDWVCVEAFEWS